MSRNGAGVYSLPGSYLAVSGETILATQHNTPLEDLEADANNARPIVAGGTGETSKAAAITSFNLVAYSSQTLTAAEQTKARTNISAPLKGRIFGLALSNNATDATNDIDIAAGEAASTETNPVLMVLSSTLTKRLDAAWAVGSGNGGLDTGSITNATYHIWLIQRSDTGVVDALFSTSASAPTMPANYDRKRRIGSILRESTAIVQFVQVGDRFNRAIKSDRNNTAAFTSALYGLSVPFGIVVSPLFRVSVQSTSIISCDVGVGGANFGSDEFALISHRSVGTAVERTDQFVSGLIATNTSSQIYFAQTNNTGTPSLSQLSTFGWIDRRGQDGGL